MIIRQLASSFQTCGRYQKAIMDNFVVKCLVEIIIPLHINTEGGWLYWNHFVHLSIHFSVCLFVLLSVCLVLSRRYLLHRLTIFNQTWYSGVLSWGGSVMNKNWFTIFNVKVTERAYIHVSKMWQFFTVSFKLLVCMQPNLVW